MEFCFSAAMEKEREEDDAETLLRFLTASNNGGKPKSQKFHRKWKEDEENPRQKIDFPCKKENNGVYKVVRIRDDKYEVRRIYGEIEEIVDMVETKFRLFDNFDVFHSPPSDHKFLNRRNFLKLFDPSKTRMESEWESLNAGLPSSIFVRTYQSNKDLFRAAIVGLQGTPYSDGLFFFDIFLPSNYPTKSPEIYYHSRSHNLLTELHEQGKVDPNTVRNWTKFHGKQESNILQILVSIQNFLYQSEQKRLESGKSVFLLTCEAMLNTMRHPPKNFEDFVAGHFRTRANSILVKYKEKKNGEKSRDELFLRLIKAFEANGTYCKHHYSKTDN